MSQVKLLTETNANATYVAQAAQTKHAPGLGLWFPEAEGAVADGTTDDSTAINAAVLACANAGGGTVLFQPGHTYRWDSVVIPNDGGTIPKQAPVTLAGGGSRWDGEWQGNGTPPGATVLDLRSTTGPAKIDTRGSGVLNIRDIVLTQTQGATDTNPFIQTTNTTVLLDNVAFYGYSTLSGSACVQDAVVLGGTTTTLGNGSTAAFQGYGTVIRRCYFARIRRAVYGRVYANSVQIQNNTISNTCGSDNTGAAIHFDGGAAYANANMITNNLIEMGGYVYGIRFAKSASNYCEGNAFWDSTGSLVGCYRLDGTANDVADSYLGGMFPGVATNKYISDGTAGATYLLRQSAYLLGAILGAATNYVQPRSATGSESTGILKVSRSLAESSNPGSDIFVVRQSGGLLIGGAWSTGASATIINGSAQVAIDSTSLVKNSGPLDLWPGNAAATDAVRIRRGLFKLPLYTTAGRPSGAAAEQGTVYFDTTLNKPVFNDGANNWRDAAGNIV